MAKIANQYFKVHPWKIIESGFSSQHNKVSESIFSLGNEHMGVRGYFEEGGSCDSLLGSYFNGIYENGQLENPSIYKGIVNSSHFMVNAVDWLYTRIFLDDEQLDLGKVEIEQFNRTLDLRTGVLTREFQWITKNNKKIKIMFERFLHMERFTEGYQKITFVPENFSGQLRIILGLDLNTKHASHDKAYWKEGKKTVAKNMAAIIGNTVSSNQRIFSGFTYQTDAESNSSLIVRENFVGYELNLALTQMKQTQVTKLIFNKVEKKITQSENVFWESGIHGLVTQGAIGYENAKTSQIAFWDNFWKNGDIEIEGDASNQQGIRFCLFQMQQTYAGRDPSNNIGAKGLTGEAYGGHAFWDTETCCLPYYLFTNLKAAKNLIEFRYKTLEEAKKRALALDCKGACYPISTLNGKESCHLWQHASTQFQPSTGVAYAIWHYVHISQDTDFLFNHGIEMLVEIARFLESRGDWGQQSGKFGFYGVMGPDEFQVMVNHNMYTNYMAKKTFEYTIEVLQTMKEKVPDLYKLLQQKTNIEDSEINHWQHCAKHMLIIQTKEGIFEQHQGFFDLPHIDIHKIPVTDFPLYHHWSYDRIYRNDMIKQPDVLMFQFLYNQQFTVNEKLVNYEYYEPRTIHESSLSPSVHSILANELHKYEEAYTFFKFATRMDLDNYNRNTDEGLHTTSIAAAWVNIVYGFGGLRSDGPIVLLNPTIPKNWSKYTFKIEYREAMISVIVFQDKVICKVENNKQIELKIYNKIYQLSKQPLEITIPKSWGNN